MSGTWDLRVVAVICNDRVGKKIRVKCNQDEYIRFVVRKKNN